jgi:hypothetical protein
MALYEVRSPRWIEATWLTLLGIFALAPQLALAQQARPGAIAHPAAGYYARPLPAHPARAVVSRPVLIRPMMARAIPQRPIASRYPRLMPHPRPTSPIGLRTFVPVTFVSPTFAPLSFGGPRAFSDGSQWLGLGPRGNFNPFWFGNPNFSAAGYFGPLANQMLPLGYGLWPACDSSSTPGRFWSIGPCAGIGDYASLTPNPENQFTLGNTAPAWYFQMPPEIFISAPQAAEPTANKIGPVETKPNMVVYLTDGRAVPVSDWWVTQGRFYFVTLKGSTQTVDLSTLALRKTIEENEKQGLTFILNFTPPNERPVLPPLP